MWSKVNTHHCWCEYKLVQPLWKSVWWFLRKLGINLLQDPAIPLLGICRKDTQSYQPAFLDHPGSPVQSSTTPSKLGPLNSVSGKCTSGLPSGKSYRGIFSVEILFYQMTLLCVKLTKIQPGQLTPCQLDTQTSIFT